MDANAADQPYLSCQQAKLPATVNHSSYSMSQRPSQLNDQFDLASRRASGRTRKLTEKYQALTGSKLLPVESANIASEELGSPTNSSSPDEMLQITKQSRRSSTSTAQSDQQNTVARSTTLKNTSPKVDKEAEPQLAALDAVEESPRRALRRERKPTTKFLESIAAPNVSDDIEEESARASQRRRRSSAKASEAEPAPSLRGSPVQPPKDHFRRKDASTSPRQPTSLAEDKAQAEVKAPRKRSGSPPKEVAQAKISKVSPKPSLPVAQTDTVVPRPELPTSPNRSLARVRPPRLSLKPPRRPSSLRFAVSSGEDEKGNTAHGQIEARRVASSVYSATEDLSVNGVGSKPYKVVTLRYGVAPARLSQMHDATPIRFSPMVADQKETEAEGKKCSLFCLSPSSRILAFAQLAAESTDSDEDDDDDDDDSDEITEITKPPSHELYEKWIARGRERFCVCNKQAATHAHPASAKSATSELQRENAPNGARTWSSKDPFLSDLREDAEMAAALPPVNSIIWASEGRKASALYNAITDNASAARPGKFSTSAISKKRLSVPTKSKSYEERMSEDYRALEAIRQQATLEGIHVRHNMDYAQVKALLDEHRMDASNGFGHGHGLVQVGSRPIRQ